MGNLTSSGTFPELDRLQKLLEKAKDLINIHELGTVTVPAAYGHSEKTFPILAFTMGSADKSAPVLGLFGGVHGLERVGTQLLLSYFEGLFEQSRWDKELAKRFEGVRLVSIPLVNPGGMFLGTRSNPNGVDLNRNAPVEAKVKPAWLLGGHRWSRRLPYFRGTENEKMEIEAQALVDFVRREMFASKAAIALDVHSGFGARDRLWYPYAKTTEVFPRLPEIEKLKEILDLSYPNHVYSIEAQSLSYTTHGDLWDYIYDEHEKLYAGQKSVPFIPWTLEMGSWIWVRKNPTQLFSALGVFNPIKEHRYRRTMRRHLPLLDFFLRAVKNYEAWSNTTGKKENP